MKSLQSPNKEKKNEVKEKFKLNYKHFNNESPHCSRECLTKSLKSQVRMYHKSYPISQKSGNGLESDVLFNLVQRKQEYQTKMQAVKYKYHKYQKTFNVCEQFQSYQVLQDLLAQEPDKYFASNYNWYYTGGNLSMQNIGNIELMFHTTNNPELCVARIRKKSSGWTLKKERVLSNHSSEIYQLNSVNNSLKTFVGVRQKNDILLYDVKIDENEDVVCALANIQNTDVPFVSMCLNPQSDEEYVAVNAAQSLQIWDIFTLKPACEYQVPHDLEALEGDCFAQVSYYDNNTLAYINRTNSYMFDKRSCNISTHLKLDKTDILERHDRFVNICPRQNNPSQYYISTYRDVLVFDLRRNNVVHKYSHGFASAPYISDLIRGENNTSTFCISTCKPDEKLIFEQKETETYYIPFSLRSQTHSFENSLLSSSNMDMSSSIRERLNGSTTGLQLWCSGDDTVVFSVNVFGDIFCHEITKSPAEDNNLHYFQKWNNKILDNREVSNQFDYMDKLVLQDVPLQFRDEPVDLVSVIKSKRIQDSIQELKQGRKGFCTNICDVWENVSERNALDDIEEIPAEVSVRNWLTQFCPKQEEPDS